MSDQKYTDDCPEGLECLKDLDMLHVEQQISWLEVFSGFDSANQYKIKNKKSDDILYAMETTGCCTRCCCGSVRPFTIKIVDKKKKEVMVLTRPMRMKSIWCAILPINCCCLQDMTIKDAKENLLGHVTQNYTCCAPAFDVNDAKGKTQFVVKGHMCEICGCCNCCGEVDFDIEDSNGKKVGILTREWSAKQIISSSVDNFGVTFPKETSSSNKALLMATVFLLDFMYFGSDVAKQAAEAAAIAGATGAASKDGGKGGKDMKKK